MQRTHWWLEQMKQMDAIAMDSFIKDMIESDRERQIQQLQFEEQQIIRKYNELKRVKEEKLNILKKALEQEIKEIERDCNNELLKLQMGRMDTGQLARAEILYNKSTSAESTQQDMD